MRTALKKKHVTGAVAYVRHCGGDDPIVTCNGAVHLSWTHEGRPLAISMSAKTRNAERSLQLAEQSIRRAYKSIDVEVRA